MHEGRAPVDLLHPVHADVASAGSGVVRDHRGQGDERRRVVRPAGLDRERVQVNVVAGEHDLLAGAAAHRLRPRVGDRLQLQQPLGLLDQALGRLHLEHVGELLTDVVEPLDAEGEAHAPLRAELVDQQRVVAALRVLEQQRRPAGFHGAVDDLGDLEVWVDLSGNPDELSFALEQGDPCAEVGRRRHVRQSRTRRFRTL